MKIARVLEGINVDGEAGEVDNDGDRADVEGVADHRAFVNAVFHPELPQGNKIGRCSREGKCCPHTTALP